MFFFLIFGLYTLNLHEENVKVEEKPCGRRRSLDGMGRGVKESIM